MPPPPLESLIVTADDFGLSPEVKEAVGIAHRRGILETTRLMVGAPAGDAVARARGLVLAACSDFAAP